jgi:hypothetical protein
MSFDPAAEAEQFLRLYETARAAPGSATFQSAPACRSRSTTSTAMGLITSTSSYDIDGDVMAMVWDRGGTVDDF